MIYYFLLELQTIYLSKSRFVAGRLSPAVRETNSPSIKRTDMHVLVEF